MSPTTSLTLSLFCVGLGLIFVLLPCSLNAVAIKQDKQLTNTKTNTSEPVSNVNSTKTVPDPTKCNNGNGGDAVGGDGGSNGENGADSQGQDCNLIDSRLKRGTPGVGIGGKGGVGGKDGNGKNGISTTNIENVQIDADTNDDGGTSHNTNIAIGNISTA